MTTPSIWGVALALCARLKVEKLSAILLLFPLSMVFCKMPFLEPLVASLLCGLPGLTVDGSTLEEVMEPWAGCCLLPSTLIDLTYSLVGPARNELLKKAACKRP